MLSLVDENQAKNDKKSNFGGNHDGAVAVRLGACVKYLIEMNRKGKFWLKNRIERLKEAFKGKRFWLGLFYFLLISMVVGFVGMVVLFAWYSKDLPSPTRVVRRDGYATRIYDRNGKLLYDVYKDAKRTPVTWEDVPDYLKKATVSVEDKEFYSHKGFDPLAPFRIIKNVFYFHKLTGGSTLTQQLVKNVLLTSEYSVTRKIKEFILAVQIEAKYKKDEILLMYLNEAPYGGSAWGVGAASEQYFGKPVKELTLTECTILAGLPQRPNVYSPFSKTPMAYVARTSHVLERMVADGVIKSDVSKKALEEAKSYKFYDNKTTIMSPHFVFWLKDQLSKKYGDDMVETGGLKVTSTLDLDLQNQVQAIISEEIDKAEKLGVSNGAAVVLDPTNGQVLAMVGSRGYFSDKTDGKFNVVTQALRQPGSSIKPITYLTAIKRGWTASSMIVDAPVTFAGVGGQKDYSPQNYTGKFLGPMSLRNALGNSINTTAVKLLAKVGVENMLRQAYEMGLMTLEPTKENLSRFGLAVTLGGAEVKMIDLSSAYSAFANGGAINELSGVLKVEDKNGRILEEFKALTGKKVMTPQEAFIISNILQDNSAREITFGQSNGLIIPNYQVAVKTGTTNDKRDNWAIGWTPNLLVTTWVGNNDNTPMGKIASGVSGATPIWRRIMLYALPKRNKQDFAIPESVVSVDVDKMSGYPSHDGFPSKMDYFIDGTKPITSDPIHMKLKVCKGSNGLAPPNDVANGNYDEKEFVKLIEDDPVSSDGKNRWQEGIDQWISQQANKDLYNPPSGYCRADGLVGLNFESPSNQSTVGSSFDVKLNTDSIKKIVEMKLWINGVENKIWTERPYEVNLNLADGLYTLKARATDKDGNSSEKEIKIGVNKPWDWSPSPTPTNTPVPSPTSAPTVTPVVTAVPTI